MSDKLKPIEAGCLALVVGFKGLLALNNGKIVKALACVDTGHALTSTRIVSSDLGICWSIDTVILYYLTDQSQEYFSVCPEKYLMRIDPDDDQKKEFEKERRQMDRVIKQHVPVFIPQEIQK